MSCNYLEMFGNIFVVRFCSRMIVESQLSNSMCCAHKLINRRGSMLKCLCYIFIQCTCYLQQKVLLLIVVGPDNPTIS